jgi:hypothetical protein
MIMLEFGNKTGTDFYTDVMVSQINTILTETNEMYNLELRNLFPADVTNIFLCGQR